MCTLRARGVDFDVDAFLKTTSLTPSLVFRKGDPRRANSAPDGPKYEKSGVCIGTSDAEWSDLPAQVAETERFLLTHQEAIQSLGNMPGIEDFLLDFPIELRADGVKIAVQTDLFPSSLVRIAATMGLGLALSIYS